MGCCEHPRIVQEVGFYVCMYCGSMQNQRVYIMPSAYGRAPARPPYCRQKRFVKLLHNTWASRIPRCCDLFMKSLDSINPKTTPQILTFIRDSTHRKFKRYDCLALLSIKILHHTIPPLTAEQIAWCTGVFQKIEIRHRKVGGIFPCYPWTIERCLETLHRRDLLEYIHKLKCPRRRSRYECIYGNLFTHCM